MKNISYDQAISLIKLYNPVILDVQLRLDYPKRHLQGSINIPVENINNEINQVVINKNQMIIVYCLKGIRSETACDMLIRLGYNNIYNIEGGIDS